MKNIEINDNLTIYYPLDMKPRKQQLNAIEFTKQAINNEKKFILLDLPPGGGKSYFGIPMFSNWYKNNIDPNAKFDILTNSKMLQEQYIKDFPYIKNLKGKSNYWCEKNNTDCEKGEEICKASKTSCNSCPYKRACLEWTESDISITNFHMFDTLSIFVPERLRNRKAGVLIVDEAHDFENVFCDYLSCKINARIIKKCGFSDKEVREIDDKLARMRDIEHYSSFISNYLLNRLESLIGQFKFKLSSNKTSEKKKKEISGFSKNASSMLSKLKNFIEEYTSEPKKDDKNANENEVENPKDNWVLDINKNPKEALYSGIELIAQPVWSNKYLKKYVWDHYDHVIFMSGTFLDKDLIVYLNEFDKNLTEYKQFDSVFPIKRRPIYYIKAGKMTYKEKVKTFQEQKKWVKKILNKNKNRKGLIHTNTYEVSDWFKMQIREPRFLFHTSIDKDEMLRLHKNSDDPTIMVSPSMISGVDLKDDLSRFQIISKIPYPNISSNKVKQRQKTNTNWYNWKTVIDVIQAYGRSIRSVDDWAETYILDSSFSNILVNPMLPRYISDAVRILEV